MTMETEMTEAEMRWQERKIEAEEKRQNLVSDFSRFVNGASADEIKEFCTDISRDHRTLVQAKFGVFLQFAKILASYDKTGNYDARNEYAVKTSVKIMEVTDGIAAVPFV
jgi:hypothetical protein